MIINNNIPALNTHRQMGINQNAMQNSMEKLSSGLRINRAGDDAAGLAISEKMRAQINGLDQASRNAQDGISMIQTAEGALSETHDILQRMRELAVQAGNDTNVAIDREEIQKEMNQLTSEINRIGNTTEFNTQNLLDGGAGGASELTAAATGTGEVSLTPVEEVLGAYTVEVTAATAAGGEITIDGTTLSLGDTDGAEEIANAINSDATLSERFEASFSGNELTLTEREGQATGNDLDAGDITVTGGGDLAVASFNADQNSVEAVEGGYTLDITTAFVDGDTLEIGGVTYSFEDGGSGDNVIDTTANAGATDQATALAALIAGQDGIESATSNGTEVSIVQEGAGTGDGFTSNFQIGANQGQSMTIEIADMRASALGISGAADATADGVGDNVAGAVYTTAVDVTDGTDNAGTESALDVSTHENAAAAVEVLNQAIEEVSAQRSELGAYQNRLEHTISNLDNSSENLSAAESRIRDVDMAAEMMEMTRANILSQASQSMLAQANQQPQSVLQLLG